MTHRLQNFPHPTPFFSFNTSCFWRRNVLYLYRDMGGASAPPFFRHFPFKIGDLEAHPGKICLPLIFICLPLILIRGRQRKTMRRIGKIGGRKCSRRLKMLMSNRWKIAQNCWIFGGGSLPQPLPKGKGFSKAYPQPLPEGKGFSKPTPTPPWREGLFNFSINAHK